MSEGPEWFVQKPSGYSATPISWQGWAITLVVTATVLACAYWLQQKPLALSAIVVTMTILLTFIVVKTTKGGWRWRWRKRD